MKYKNYGDKNKQYSSGSDLELIKITDSLSARSINRPVVNLYENQEETYKLLNTLLKTVYGNTENSILPDMYEEFAPDGFVINSFSSTDKYFLRIPTGAMLLTNNKSLSSKDKLKYSEDSYEDANSEQKYSKDRFKSFAYVNKPNINLLERQYASFMNLDLNCSYNDIKIESAEIPVTYLVYIINKDAPNLPVLDSTGNIQHLTDKKGRALYICKDSSKADYYIDNGIVNFESRDIKTPDKKTNHFLKYYCFNDFNEEDGIKPINPAEHIPEGSTLLTYKFENAEYSKDVNGNNKKSIGYCLRVDQSAFNGKITKYLPNKREKNYLDVYLGKPTIKETGYYSIEIKYNGGASATIPVSIEPTFTAKEVNEKVVSTIMLSEKARSINLSAELLKNNDSYGVKFILDDSLETEHNDWELSISCGSTIITESTTFNPVVRQEYYRNIFEMTNDFLSKFKSEIVSTSSVNDYITGETFLELKRPVAGIKEEGNDYFIYYDLNCEYNSSIKKDGYDNSRRLFISEDDLKDDNLIKLFKVTAIWNDVLDGRSPKVSKIEYFAKRLDKRLIGTKRAEFNTLYSNLRTNLETEFTYKDTNGRSIEILENPSSKETDTQIRSKAPIFRISTLDKSEKGTAVYNGSGDDPSNFTDEYHTKNYSTGSIATYHHTNKDIGFIIDKDHGILLYNGTESDPQTLVEKPIEILSENGNINILNNNNEKSTISIRNNKDSEGNLVDIKGLTKIRSKNDSQLTVEALDTQKSTAIKFKTDKELGRIQFKDDAGASHNVIEVGTNKKVIDSTESKTTVNNKDIEFNGKITANGETLYTGNFKVQDKNPANSTFELNDIGISSVVNNTITNTAEDKKAATSSVNTIKSDGTITNAATSTITNKVGSNTSTISSDGTITNTAKKSITNDVDGNASTISSDGTITNTAKKSITNTVGSSIVEISSDNSITTTSAKTTIDNGAENATIEIGDNQSGEKTITIGNDVANTNINIKGNATEGGVNITGQTNINKDSTSTTDIGTGSTANTINIGNDKSATNINGTFKATKKATETTTNQVIINDQSIEISKEKKSIIKLHKIENKEHILINSYDIVNVNNDDNRATETNIGNDNKDSTIAMIAGKTITNTVGSNKIEIKSSGSDNSIVTTSAATTIDNGTGNATIKIGDNSSGKKTITIGNSVNESNVTIKGDPTKETGGINITGYTNINKDSTSTTNVGTGSKANIINIGNNNSTTNINGKIAANGETLYTGNFKAQDKDPDPNSIFELKETGISSNSNKIITNTASKTDEKTTTSASNIIDSIGTISNTATLSISNTAGTNNSIVINGTTGKSDTANSIVTTSATTTIDNGAGNAIINIGNNKDGKKTIAIGNGADGSSVLIKGKTGNLISINGDNSGEIGITSSKVKITGDVEAFNNMTSNSKVSVTNDTTLNNTLTVDGATNLSGDLEVTGKNKTTLNGTLSVTNETTLNSLETTGNAKLSTIIGTGGLAGVKGDTSIGKTLSVTNDAILNSLETTGNAKLSTIDTVVGNTSINGILSVTGNAKLSSLETTDKATLSKIVGEKSGKETAGVKGATSIGGTLSVTNGAVLNSLETTDKTTLSTINTVTGNTSIGGDLSVTNDAVLNSLTTTGNATFGEISKVGNNTSISGKLTVDGDVTVGNAKTNVAEATGKLTVHGDSYVPNITTSSTDYTIANKKYVDDTTAALDTHIGKGVGDNNDSVHGSTAGSSEDIGKNKIVQRDSNGNFYAGTITAELSGNATTASSWETARKLSLSGDVSGSVDIKGDENVTLEVTVSDDSHNHVISNIDGLQNSLNSKATSASLEAHSTATENVHGATSSNTASKIVIRDSSGDFSAGTITANSFSGGSISGTSIKLGLATITADSTGNIKFSW